MKYDVEIDPAAESSHTRVLRLVGAGMRVLELGCATGSLAKLLTERGCTVVGIERDPEAARLAEQHCERVVVADLDADDLSGLRQLGGFDVVVAADVLEHLTQPDRALSVASELLLPHGYLVTSIPNVAHGSVRLALLAGRFPYSELGLLDETHVRLYTRSSMTAMLAASGFRVSYVEDQQLDPEQGEVLRDVDLESLPVEARSAVRDDPDSAVYQFIAVSSPRDDSDGLHSALRRLTDRVRSLESDLTKNEQAFKDEQARHLAEMQAFAAAAQAKENDLTAALQHAEHALLDAREETLAVQRQSQQKDVRLVADTQRIAALEAHCEALAAHVTDYQRIDNQRLAFERQLREIYGSKLWRLGTAYRRFVGNALTSR
ncbi:MAG: class I SAM-dependent methyltransferase [Mycobacteriales bacterium]